MGGHVHAGRHIGQTASADLEGSHRRPQEPGHEIEECGLSRPRRADQAHHLVVHLALHQQLEAGEAQAHAAQRQAQRGLRRSSRSPANTAANASRADTPMRR